MTSATEGVERPLLLVEHDSRDVEPFRTLESLAARIEGPDVEAGLYSAFDASGRAVELRVSGARQTRISATPGTVEAAPTDPPSYDVPRLTSALVEHLSLVGPSEDLEALPLHELVWRLLVRHGWSPEEMP